MIACREISFKDDIPWDDLIEKSSTATFFQTKDWLTLWLKHFPIKEKILGVFDGEELIGIAPFSIDNQKIDLLGVTKVVGGELVSDFGDIIIKKGKEKEVWETLLSQISPGRSPFGSPRGEADHLPGVASQHLEGEYRIELNFIREDSPSFEILKNLGGKAEEIDVAQYVDLPNTWEEYLESLDRHDRHEMKRKIRKCESENVLTVYSENVTFDTNEFFRLMALSSSQKRNFLSKNMQSFFRAVFQSFHSLGKLELCFLQKEGKNIAAVILFIYKDEVLLYNSGFDPKYGYLSPGLVLNAYAIKRAIEKGMKRFDFLRGSERYKYDLGGKERKLYKFSF